MSPYIEITARAILAVADPTPTPAPAPAYTGDPNLISPGIAGFLVTAFVAVATVLLIIDMTRRIRRVRYRAEVRERLESENLDAELRALADGGDSAPTAAAPEVAAPKPADLKPADPTPADPKPAATDDPEA